MRYRQGRIPADQEAAFNHPDVVSIADEVERHPKMALVKLVRKAILFNRDPTEQELLGLMGPSLALDPTLAGPARTIADCGVRISLRPSADECKRQRGAVLERLVWTLVKSRATVVHREQQIELTVNPRSRNQWTHPKEILVDEHPFEVFECKSDGMVDIGDIDELSDIWSTATAEGTVSRPTVATLDSEMRLRAMAPAWRLREPIYYAAIDQLLELRERPATLDLNQIHARPI
jgi:hypothetical protein